MTVLVSSRALGVRAGYVFELEDGPSDLPTRYLAIEVRHAGAVTVGTGEVARYTGLDRNETYRLDVTAIPADVQFRAPQATPWPRIYGFEDGMVDGPATSQYAQVDDHGRYLVRFKFDESGLADGGASTYLRMMQPHGGTIEGWHFPLRKGTEVMVAFQGGDPDRPVMSVLGQCNFMAARLENATFEGATGPQCFFGEARLTRASFKNGRFSQAVFERAELTGADLEGAILEEVYFGGATAPGARFVDARLREANFSHADVSSADFSGASLFRTKFHRARRDGAKLCWLAGWLGDDDELARVEDWQPRHGAERADPATPDTKDTKERQSP